MDSSSGSVEGSSIMALEPASSQLVRPDPNLVNRQNYRVQPPGAPSFSTPGEYEQAPAFRGLLPVPPPPYVLARANLAQPRYGHFRQALLPRSAQGLHAAPRSRQHLKQSPPVAGPILGPEPSNEYHMRKALPPSLGPLNLLPQVPHQRMEMEVDLNNGGPVTINDILTTTTTTMRPAQKWSQLLPSILPLVPLSEQTLNDMLDGSFNNCQSAVANSESSPSVLNFDEEEAAAASAEGGGCEMDASCQQWSNVVGLREFFANAQGETCPDQQQEAGRIPSRQQDPVAAPPGAAQCAVVKREMDEAPCPLCHETFDRNRLVTESCGHVYCRQCFVRNVVRHNDECGQCKEDQVVSDLPDLSTDANLFEGLLPALPAPADEVRQLPSSDMVPKSSNTRGRGRGRGHSRGRRGAAVYRRRLSIGRLISEAEIGNQTPPEDTVEQSQPSSNSIQQTGPSGVLPEVAGPEILTGTSSPFGRVQQSGPPLIPIQHLIETKMNHSVSVISDTAVVIRRTAAVSTSPTTSKLYKNALATQSDMSSMRSILPEVALANQTDYGPDEQSVSCTIATQTEGDELSEKLPEQCVPAKSPTTTQVHWKKGYGGVPKTASHPSTSVETTLTLGSASTPTTKIASTANVKVSARQLQTAPVNMVISQGTTPSTETENPIAPLALAMASQTANNNETEGSQGASSSAGTTSEKPKKRRNPVPIYDHITFLGGDPPQYQCDVCMKKFKTKAHIKYHEFCRQGEKPFKCEQCGQGFIAKSHYEYHLRTHTGERPYVCPKCGKGFNQRGKVTRHMRSHTGEKPFICGMCSRGFANAQALRSHSLIHTGERPFACQYCNKRFTGMTNLKKHVITHTGERPFQCNDCGKSFGLKWTLDLHLRTHSTERPYVCDTCSRAFSNSKDLRRHAVIHSGERPFNCWICGTAFRRKDNLDRHIKNTHNQPKEVARQLANEAAANYNAKKLAEQKETGNAGTKSPKQPTRAQKAILDLIGDSTEKAVDLSVTGTSENTETVETSKADSTTSENEFQAHLVTPSAPQQSTPKAIGDSVPSAAQNTSKNSPSSEPIPDRMDVPTSSHQGSRSPNKNQIPTEKFSIILNGKRLWVRAVPQSPRAEAEVPRSSEEAIPETPASPRASPKARVSVETAVGLPLMYSAPGLPAALYQAQIMQHQQQQPPAATSVIHSAPPRMDAGPRAQHLQQFQRFPAPQAPPVIRRRPSSAEVDLGTLNAIIAAGGSITLPADRSSPELIRALNVIQQAQTMGAECQKIVHIGDKRYLERPDGVLYPIPPELVSQDSILESALNQLNQQQQKRQSSNSPPPLNPSPGPSSQNQQLRNLMFYGNGVTVLRIPDNDPTGLTESREHVIQPRLDCDQMIEFVEMDHHHRPPSPVDMKPFASDESPPFTISDVRSEAIPESSPVETSRAQSQFEYGSSQDDEMDVDRDLVIDTSNFAAESAGSYGFGPVDD